MYILQRSVGWGGGASTLKLFVLAKLYKTIPWKLFERQPQEFCFALVTNNNQIIFYCIEVINKVAFEILCPWRKIKSTYSYW